MYLQDESIQTSYDLLLKETSPARTAPQADIPFQSDSCPISDNKGSLTSLTVHKTGKLYQQCGAQNCRKCTKLGSITSRTVHKTGGRAPSAGRLRCNKPRYNESSLQRTVFHLPKRSLYRSAPLFVFEGVSRMLQAIKVCE